MLKAIILKLINSVFGLKLKESDLDAFVAFIKVLIDAMGSVSSAVAYVNRVSALSVKAGKVRARTVFQGVEQVMGEK